MSYYGRPLLDPATSVMVTYPAESTPEIEAFMAGYQQRSPKRRFPLPKPGRVAKLSDGMRERLEEEWGDLLTHPADRTYAKHRAGQMARGTELLKRMFNVTLP